MALNVFGIDIPDRLTTLCMTACINYIHLAFASYFEALGIVSEHRKRLADNILKTGQETVDCHEYEARIHKLLAGFVAPEAFERALEARALRIVRQVTPFLVNGPLMDYGGGEGRVARQLHNLYRPVTVADVFRHPQIAHSSLPFCLLNGEGAASVEAESFANVVLCTVLHHCTNPPAVIRNAARIARPGARFVIIESVFGVVEWVTSSNATPLTSAFVELSEKQQLAVTAFFDHFYNRCIHYSSEPSRKIAVPYNYLSGDAWQRMLWEHGLQPIELIPLGVDQPIAPLFHTLHVAVRS